MTKSPGHRRSGFTMIEIMVAVTIFSIVSVIIFAVFRTALRAQETTYRETEMLQQARFIMDTVERDFANIYFRDETSYNIAITRMIQDMEQARLRAEAEDDWEPFYQMYGNPFEEDGRDSDDVAPTIGNPYEKGRIIDLQFQASAGGDADTLSFATYAPMGIGELYRPWGLSRVEYKVQNGLLIRASRTVETDRRDQLGEIIEQTDTPEVAKLAEGVKEFKLTYAFWYDNQWYEIDNWNSASRQIRNSKYLLGDYDIEDGYNRDDTTMEFAPGVPGYNESLNDSDSEPLDRLPAYVRLRLTITDPKNEHRIQKYQKIIRVGPAVETYVPSAQVTEERRESERTMRDEEYRMISPGTMRKR